MNDITAGLIDYINMRTLFKWAGYDLFRALILCIENTLKTIDQRHTRYEKGLKTLAAIKDTKNWNENPDMDIASMNRNTNAEWVDTLQSIWDVLRRGDLIKIDLTGTWYGHMVDREIDKEFCKSITNLMSSECTKLEVYTPKGYKVKIMWSEKSEEI